MYYVVRKFVYIYYLRIYVIHVFIERKRCDTGWRGLKGCLKLQVIFRKKGTIDRALLRKMTYEDRASYDPTPPCIHVYICICVHVHIHIRRHKRVHVYTICTHRSIYVYRKDDKKISG